MAEARERGGRAEEIIATAARILEAEGPGALTMRRLGAEIGIRAPSLYKHFPDKAAVEIELINRGFEAMAETFETAFATHGESLATLAGTYRSFARERPHLYRLMTAGPLPREHLRPGVEERAAEPLVRVARNPDRARALWAFAHGMVILEIDARFPPDADLDAAWAAGLAAFGSA